MSGAGALLVRALDPAVQASDDPASARILDAALALCAASGVSNLTMDAVARRAGVGRMTVYRRFGDRESLVEALGVREARRCLAELDRALDPSAAPADQVADGFVASMRIAREHPLLNRLARVEPAALVEILNADGAAVFSLMRGFCAERVGSEEAAEALVRMCVSFVLVQDSVIAVSDDHAARAFATRTLAPMLSRP